MKADFIQLRGDITSDFEAYAQILHKVGIKINYFGTDDPVQIQNLWETGIDFPLVNDIVTAIEVGEKLGIPPVIQH